MAERYDIFTDTTRLIGPEDLEVLNAVYVAYGRVRVLKLTAMDLDDFLMDLDKIHQELTEAIEKLQSFDRLVEPDGTD